MRFMTSRHETCRCLPPRGYHTIVSVMYPFPQWKEVAHRVGQSLRDGPRWRSWFLFVFHGADRRPVGETR